MSLACKSVSLEFSLFSSSRDLPLVNVVVVPQLLVIGSIDDVHKFFMLVAIILLVSLKLKQLYKIIIKKLFKLKLNKNFACVLIFLC